MTPEQRAVMNSNYHEELPVLGIDEQGTGRTH